MKAIANNKVYDTNTATEIYEYWNGRGRSDFRKLTETLYRTPNGNYFIHGIGGPLTDWAESYGNGKEEGEGIRALTHEQVLAWIEAHRIPLDKVDISDINLVEG